MVQLYHFILSSSQLSYCSEFQILDHSKYSCFHYKLITSALFLVVFLLLLSLTCLVSLIIVSMHLELLIYMGVGSFVTILALVQLGLKELADCYAFCQQCFLVCSRNSAQTCSFILTDLILYIICQISICNYHIISTHINLQKQPYFSEQQLNRMLKSLHIPQQQLPLSQRLLQICKKSGLNNEGRPQIDFLLLERQMQQLQQIQSKTCQRIVEFVDQHLQQFIQINKKFENIGAQVEGTELIIKKIIPKLDVYKANLLSPESKMQQFITSYEKSMMQQHLADAAREQAEFLLQFVREFQQFINVNIEDLSEKQKYNIVRLLRKKEQIKIIFEHPLLHRVSNHSHDLSITLASMCEQLEFYLSQQLSRLASTKQLRSQKNGKGMLLTNQILIWYEFMGNENTYFEIIQQAIIGRKISALELLLISHKQNLIVGNDQHIVKQFFNQLFSFVQQFPPDYPTHRILKIIYKFLSKKQLNFIYSYVVPTFPISYLAYKAAVQKIANSAIRNQLENRHGWNLRLWADLRIKTIMDRSGKDKDKPLSKWIQIVLKKNFMIYGVKHFMVKLCFLLVNRFCAKIQDQMDFTAKNLNDNYNSMISIGQTLKIKLYEGYSEELSDQIKNPMIKLELEQTIRNVNQQICNTIKKWLCNGLETVINSCKNSLQPYKSYIVGIITKKQKNKSTFNSQQTILKPLRGYIKNNPQISPQCNKFIQNCVLEQIEKYYDSQYAKQIYNHCNSNTSTEQMKKVMEVVATQRQILFQRSKDGQQNKFIKNDIN